MGICLSKNDTNISKHKRHTIKILKKDDIFPELENKNDNYESDSDFDENEKILKII